MSHVLAFRTRLPANGPVWLADYDRSVVDLFRRMMPAPFTLHGYDTAELPPAADWDHALAFDHDEGNVVMSDGADWKYWAFSDHIHAMADVTGLQAALDLKAPIASPTFTGTLTASSNSATHQIGRLAIGNAGSSRPYLDSSTSAGAGIAMRSPFVFDSGGSNKFSCVNSITTHMVFEVSRGATNGFQFYTAPVTTGTLVLQMELTTAGRLTVQGGINVPTGQGYHVNSTQVVGARQSAIADDASGAANQATVNSILAALRTHGLIAT
jgi:hypothetical protein